MAPAVLATMRLLTQVAHFPSRLGECVVQQPLEVPPPSASAIAELSGLSGGYISLLAPLTVCAELVAAMIGEPVEANNRTGIEDGLTEFLNLVGGDLVARVAEDAHTLEVMLPRPGGLPELSRTDHLVAARLHVPGGDLVLSVLTRLG
jgi:CheY-specific phosphatase CheX